MTKRQLTQIIEIPQGVETVIDGTEITFKGPEGENKRKFDMNLLKLEKKDNQIIISCEKAGKKEKRGMNTNAAHIRNMIKGVLNKFEYTLKICFSHFPMTVEIEGNNVKIKNFLGEKVARKASIPQGVDVKVEKDKIIILSQNKELAGQAAANFEAATKVRARDRRIFQDGIYITNKDGREI